MENYSIEELQITEALDEMTFVQQKKNIKTFDEKYESSLKKFIAKKELSFCEKESIYLFASKETKELLLQEYFMHFVDFLFTEIYLKYRNYRNNLETELDKESEVYMELAYFDSISQRHLICYYNDWKFNVIENNQLYKNSNKLLDNLKSEINKQIKLYMNDLKINYYTSSYDHEIFNSEKFMLYMHSKWVYLLSQKIIENYKNNYNYYNLKLNNHEIRFTVKSLIHILIRHYSHLSKIAEKYKNEIECSNHNENIHFEKIHLNLDNIFRNIDNSKLISNIDFFQNLDIEKKKINFQFKGQIYRVWVSLNLNESESGRIPFKEIETFYPLTKVDELTELKSNFNKVKINDDLYFYLENLK